MKKRELRAELAEAIAKRAGDTKVKESVLPTAVSETLLDEITGGGGFSAYAKWPRGCCGSLN